MLFEVLVSTVFSCQFYVSKNRGRLKSSLAFNCSYIIADYSFSALGALASKKHGSHLESSIHQPEL